MLVVHVHVRVRPERAVAEMMAVPRESAKFAAVFPAGDEGWKSGSR